ncbi:hypothetical protein [Paenibacillus sp. OV219]|uniref:hypothetical protein n=1 Tax=Paenibacillus sp. OV219 TaxID=1884377 RepID=UPI0008CC4C60|nr:hypothetical protein [Paenibacillus sp. OV219]SEN20508.1 hypothetical protein SAMN05518847_102409 [Paenibacillus sp. OV219]
MKFKLLKRVFSHYEKLQAAKEKGVAALALFGKAYDQLEEANTELHALAEDASQKANDLLRHADNARLEIQMNQAAQQNLNQFIIR